MGFNGRSNCHGYTIFVDNIPQSLDKFGLKGIFQRAGRVSESFIPLNQGRLRKRYGFVRFWNEVDARNSIRVLNNTMVRGIRIRVSFAKYGKGSRGTLVKSGSSRSGWMLSLIHI